VDYFLFVCSIPGFQKTGLCLILNTDLFLTILFFVLGSIWGSFANVLILRIPEEKSIVPGSHCRSCGKSIRWYHNIPIFSWLILRGRCANCDKSISVQYFIVELMMSLLFMAAFLKFGLSWFLLEILIFIFASVTASFIDLKHFILPDVFTLGGLVLGLIGAALNPERAFLDGFLGFLLGGGFLYLTAYVHFAIRKVEGMGGGDIKLVAWIGAVLGWQCLPFVFLIASVTGVGAAVIRSLLKRGHLQEPIPFGPFLTIAALIYVFASGPTMVQSLFSVL
jgi:leader peptidase (prepilin peptidase) / N-methyltransferase